MKVFVIILIFMLIKIELCQSSMTDETVCKIVKSSTKLKCETQNEQLVINWDSYVLMIKNSMNTVQFKCVRSRSINFHGFPLLDISDVRVLEVIGCSMKNQTILSEIKDNFNLINLLHVKIVMADEKVEILPVLFESFGKLKSLDFTATKSNTLTENSFRELHSLKEFMLNIYDIASVPYSLFMPLSSLSKLDILGTATSIKNKTIDFALTFSECRKLENFTMSGMRWPVKLGLTFDRMLATIELSNNQITELSGNIFGLTRQIELIDLSKNRIEILPLNLLSNQEDLETINLSHNKITRIDNDLFSNNIILGEIDLSYNHIDFIANNAFSKLNNLKLLILNDNNLDKIILENVLNGLSSLEFLYLQNNKISSVTSELPKMEHLIQIDLSNNHLKEFFVFQFFSKSPHNLIIKLMDNYLESFDFHYINLYADEYEGTLTIDMGDTPMNCNCRTLNLYEFFHKKLSSNNIIYENLKIIPRDVKCNQSTASSSQTVISMEPDKNLCELDTFPHQILCPKECYCEIHHVKRTLNVQCNNISHVPQLPPQESLKRRDIEKIQLKVNMNIIERLPSKFEHNFNAVTEIDASFNHIKYLHELNLPDNLEVLDLRVNRLKFIEPNVLRKFENLTSIYLSRNPWNCSSPYAKDLILFVKTHREIVKDFNSIRCTDNMYFLEIKDSECFSKILISIIVILLLLTIVGVYILCYHNRQSIVEYFYEKDSRHIMEKSISFVKKIDACIVCANCDKIFANYIGMKLITKPSSFKCALIVKDWSNEEKIPKKILKAFRNSRRIIIILTDFFDENDWQKWKFSAISSRIIFITKGTITADEIELRNKMSVRFNDGLFWDKLKYAMTNYDELKIDSNTDVELEPLFKV